MNHNLLFFITNAMTTASGKFSRKVFFKLSFCYRNYLNLFVSVVKFYIQNILNCYGIMRKLGSLDFSHVIHSSTTPRPQCSVLRSHSTPYFLAIFTEREQLYTPLFSIFLAKKVKASEQQVPSCLWVHTISQDLWHSVHIICQMNEKNIRHLKWY